MPRFSSSARIAFTAWWRWSNDLPSNPPHTITTLKWDSEPAGTLCL